MTLCLRRRRHAATSVCQTMTSTASNDDAPWFTQEAPELLQSFDTNVGILVKELGTTVVVPWLPNVLCWTISLRSARVELQLQVYKERPEENASTVCDHCRIIGIGQVLSFPFETALCNCGLLLFRLAESSCVKTPLPFHSACG